ncbi:MAG: aspartyl/asparaginyl beta-hydroxylase domain-containing protein [Alphaproteobacteria bacterium]|nr:aspartyl/asparaginyl beta-hydroxylase domain-containing protein [Alphaproteobacteria bacterium]
MADQSESWRSQLARADELMSRGERAAAATVYARSLSLAPPDQDLPSTDAAELARARRTLAETSGSMEAYLRARLAAAQRTDGAADAASRCDRALDVLFGRRQLYFQQPQKFYFPDLPQTEFYDPAEFEWTKALIEATNDIAAELAAYLSKEGDAFEAYVPAQARTAVAGVSPLTGNRDWGALHFYRDGTPDYDLIERFPATMKALSHAPRPDVPTLSPTALFSRLRPGTHIPPHHGLVNTRLICHLPIITPDACALRVGSQTRQWRPGDMLIFDDSIEHEAWNRSDKERVVLLFDIWRPELTEDERRFVQTIFQSVAEFGG